MKFDPSLLKEGDAMLFYEPTLLDTLIAVKTSFWCAHIEIYDGDGQSVASRNGIGVNRYPVRLNGLIAVRRPKTCIDWQMGQEWFEKHARWQKYDFKGLMCFYLAVKQGSPHRMFCSEFALRRYRASCFQPFNPNQDADRTSPGLFWSSGTFESIWESGATV